MRLAIAAGLVLLSSAAFAKDVSVTVTDGDQANWAAVSSAFDACVSGATLRGDAAACRNVSAFMGIFAQKVAAEVAKATSVPTAPVDPAPAAPATADKPK